MNSAIAAVHDLTEFLKSQSWTKEKFKSARKDTYREQFTSQLAAARTLGARGAIPESQDALRLAHRFFWQMFAEESAVLIRFGAEATAPEIWKAAKEQGKLSTEIDARLNAARGYLFGSIREDEFVPTTFQEVVELLKEVATPPLGQRAENGA